MVMPLALSDAASTVIAALAGLVGAAIGGFVTYAVTVRSFREQRDVAAANVKSVAQATALLIQDDFLHYEATLARSLDRCTWWKPTELLPAQATVADRKAVWVALPDAQTWVVAGAQGWMDYLAGCRQLQPAGDTPPLAANDAATMRDTLAKLETAREQLAGFIGRPFTPFDTCGVVDQLTNCRSYHDLLNRRCGDPGGDHGADAGGRAPAPACRRPRWFRARG